MKTYSRLYSLGDSAVAWIVPKNSIFNQGARRWQAGMRLPEITFMRIYV